MQTPAARISHFENHSNYVLMNNDGSVRGEITRAVRDILLHWRMSTELEWDTSCGLHLAGMSNGRELDVIRSSSFVRDVYESESKEK